MQVRAILALAVISFALTCASCGPRAGTTGAPQNAAPTAGGHRIAAVVSILPQQFFVQRVGGPGVAVTVLVGPGDEPHTFEPTPEKMAALESADVYFRIGMTFEDALTQKIQATVPRLLVVDTRQGIKLRPMESGRARGGDLDPHIWLDPKPVKVQAQTIRDALARVNPSGAGEYDRNLQAFDRELDAVDREIARMLAPYRGRKFLVFHPAFGYFAAAYGLQQLAVEVEGKEPGAEDLAAIISTARREGLRTIFVEPQFSAKSAAAVAREIGGRVVPLDDLGPDYLSNLRDIARKIRDAVAAG